MDGFCVPMCFLKLLYISRVIVNKKIPKLLVFVSKRACLTQCYLIPNKIVNEILQMSFSIFQ